MDHPADSTGTLNREVCRYLRARNSYGGREGGAYPWVLLDPTTMIFQCARTLQTVGPDNGLATLDHCRRGRPCWREPIREEE